MNLILQRQRLLLLDRPAASGYRHLSAASGLVQVGETLYVIGDDEVHVAAFSITGDAPGRLIRLFSGSLPRDRDRRKAAKPDLELLLALPVGRDRPYGALLTIGSGSTRQRQRGAIAILNAAGDVVKVSALDLSRLFRTIASVVDEVNVEGAALLGNRLILLNRGSTSYPDTVVLGLDLISTLEGGTPSILFRRTLRVYPWVLPMRAQWMTAHLSSRPSPRTPGTRMRMVAVLVPRSACWMMTSMSSSSNL